MKQKINNLSVSKELKFQLQELLLNSISKSEESQEDGEQIYQNQEDSDLENLEENHNQNHCSQNCGKICVYSLASSPTVNYLES